MRIGFYTFSFLPIIGGAELLLHSLAGSLTDRGHQVTVWAPRVRGRDNRVAARYRLRRYTRPSSKRFGARQVLVGMLLQTWRRCSHVLHCHGAYPAGCAGAAFKWVTRTPLLNRPHGTGILRGMMATLAHRGPDEEQISVENRAGLGTRRLAIIDLLGGRQPMTNEDKSVWVVFNDEVYDFRELWDGRAA